MESLSVAEAGAAECFEGLTESLHRFWAEIVSVNGMINSREEEGRINDKYIKAVRRCGGETATEACKLLGIGKYDRVDEKIMQDWFINKYTKGSGRETWEIWSEESSYKYGCELRHLPLTEEEKNGVIHAKINGEGGNGKSMHWQEWLNAMTFRMWLPYGNPNESKIRGTRSEERVVSATNKSILAVVRNTRGAHRAIIAGRGSTDQKVLEHYFVHGKESFKTYILLLVIDIGCQLQRTIAGSRFGAKTGVNDSAVRPGGRLPVLSSGRGMRSFEQTKGAGSRNIEGIGTLGKMTGGDPEGLWCPSRWCVMYGVTENDGENTAELSRIRGEFDRWEREENKKGEKTGSMAMKATGAGTITARINGERRDIPSSVTGLLEDLKEEYGDNPYTRSGSQ